MIKITLNNTFCNLKFAFTCRFIYFSHVYCNILILGLQYICSFNRHSDQVFNMKSLTVHVSCVLLLFHLSWIKNTYSDNVYKMHIYVKYNI